MKNTRACVLKLKPSLDQYGPRDLVLWLELVIHGKSISDNLVTFARPKHLALHRPRFTTKIRALANGLFRVTLRTDRPALWVWLELSTDARFSDNFFHLRPGKTMTITVSPARNTTLTTFRKHLTIHSLVDTYA